MLHWSHLRVQALFMTEIPAVTTATTGATLLLYVSFNLVALFSLCAPACTKTTLQTASELPIS